MSVLSDTWLVPKFDHIPALLRDHSRWVVWNDENGRKVPCAAAAPHKGVNAHDPTHWGDFASAVAAHHASHTTGLGFVLGQTDGLCFAGVDLDDCRDPATGVLAAWARQIVEQIDSYTEISPSGTGVKIFVTGSLPQDAKQGKRRHIEIYDRHRYFTVTGHHLTGSPSSVESREEQLRELHRVAWSTSVLDLVKLYGYHLKAQEPWLHITCPWAREHTKPDGVKDTALRVQNGNAIGFKCLHAHCQHRRLKDVLGFFGLDSSRAETQSRTVRLTFADTITPRPIQWLWDRWLPLGALALLAGRENVGKTTFAYTKAADITQGRLPGIYENQPRHVIIAATEDSWESTIVPRLMAAGADLRRIAQVEVETGDGVISDLNLPKDVAALGALVKEHNAALVLLDPLMSRLDGKLDTHKDADVRNALEPLVRLADDTHATVLGIIHVNKGSSRDPLTTVMGSRAFTAVPRTVLFVAQDPDDEETRMLGQIKSNLGGGQPTLTFRIEGVTVNAPPAGDIQTSKLKWMGETDQSIRDVLAGEHSGSHTAVDAATKWLRDYFEARDGVAESKLVKAAGKATGHSESSVKRASKQLGVTSKNVGYPKTTLWLMPGKLADSITACAGESGAAINVNQTTASDNGHPAAPAPSSVASEAQSDSQGAEPVH